MSIDPKKDPARCCLPVECWPDLDRRAWDAALRTGDVLELGGAGADWAPHSRRKIAKGYGRWLTWLQTRGLLDPRVDPSERVTAERVRDYVVELRALNAPYTVLARVQEIYQAIRAMTPERDWAWLNRIEARVRHGAVSVRDKRSRVVPSEELLAFGIEIMNTSDRAGGISRLKRAARYRNGLMIALLSARPLRRRNFARIEIGRHLVRQSDGYWLRFDSNETKIGKPIEAPFPDALLPQLERYLLGYRPFLLHRDRCREGRCHPSGDPALWISVSGSAMTEIGIYFCISQLTRTRFGHVISPHLFRDSAATSIVIEDPEHVHVIRSILGHTTLRTSERHYIHAQSLEASRRYQRRILELRRKLPRRLEVR
jgi:integrase/recombinase XerD